MNVGVVIGRFQVDKLHAGHEQLFDHAIGASESLLVLIGVAPVLYTKENPLDYDTRKVMIEQYLDKEYEGTDYQIHPVLDVIKDDQWSDNVDSLIGVLYPGYDVTLYGSRESFMPYYHGKYTKTYVDAVDGASGTKLRESLKTYYVDSCVERAAQIKGIMNQYDKVHATVDIAILNGQHLLLGRKKNETAFRFVGGFSDPKDGSFERAAIRETYEETGLEIDDLEYIGSYKIDDWRYRNKADQIITTFFLGHVVGSAHATANDDIVEIQWFDLSTFFNIKVVPTHLPLLRALETYLRRKGLIK